MEKPTNNINYQREREMFPYAYCYLNCFYPRKEDWKYSFTRDQKLALPDFVIEKNSGKTSCTALVAVRKQEQITSENIIQMKNYERIFRHKKSQKIEKILIVPYGCDISLVPHDIRIIFLKEFKLKSA
jgi:hypothetical protein